MKKYEYKLIVIGTTTKTEAVNKLNELGKEGWRLVPSFSFNDSSSMLVEREKED